jgi:hypothetical protein
MSHRFRPDPPESADHNHSRGVNSAMIIEPIQSPR